MANLDKTLLIVTPSSPNGAKGQYFPVPIALIGNPTFDKVTGSGGWQVVERPKQKSATQWYDESPYELVIEGMLDPTVTNSSRTVDRDLAQILSWQAVPTLAASVIQPPTLKLSGPVLGTDLTWVVYSCKTGEAIRKSHNTGILPVGALVQQAITLTLYEYIPPFASQTSPAATHKKNNKTGSPKTYTIMAGNTLAGIAAREMKGSPLSLIQREQDIIAANKNLNLRSTSQIKRLVGQKIKIPSA